MPGRRQGLRHPSFFVSLLAVLALTTGGCYWLASRPQNPAFVFGCEEDYTFTATFDDDSVLLKLPDRTVRLPHVLSADGARYSDGQITFWNKGDSALLELGNRTYRNCVTHQPPL
ncbi:MAG TPA: MliC family protein [Oscillatoriaceae cyanobacterium]